VPSWEIGAWAHEYDSHSASSEQALKAKQFGLEAAEPGQALNNAERLKGELCDLAAVCAMLEKEARVDLSSHSQEALNQKILNVEKYIKRSQRLGMVRPD